MLNINYESAKTEVERLVDRFARNLDVYKRAEYKETQVRVEFIDPFFETLGWDVRNVQGYAEQYKDVIHENAIKVSGMTRAPDYCFRIGGVRKFFLEAKKPSVSVQEDVGPAYQLRRYAWSAKLPLSILTDFEEFAVYDCRQRPQPSDKVSVGRILYLTFDQYLDRFDDIYGVFAKESVLKGSFDRYVQDTRGKRGTSEVDAEFLKEIEGWREALARNIALRNPALSVHELNFSVQRTIDRIIFLRMCEDRGIEGYGRLLALTGGPHIYPRLGDLYRQADEKYDSDLFDFQADTLSKTLAVDDKVLNPILAGLYYPQSPYEFSVLPAEILGQVYEQFLGKVIRLTPGHRAKVEEKPEVKKAGGVYYTPTYIVDYIVQQTVGKLVEGKTPRQISKLRVLDPACGSGSFLLGAYQYLLDYHRQWYEAHDPDEHAQGKRPAIYQAPTPSPSPAGGGGVGKGAWRLTTTEKKRILLNNIYGVDIDRQAVEVTKLSLLLKVLEGETDETLGQQLMLWRERALPDLGDNIKCGNSLIGPDYFEAQLMPDEEEMRRVNPFDWEAGFPEVMAAGGFDAVIGNPPYGAWFQDAELKYFDSHYEVFRGVKDVYTCFMEKGTRLLKTGGRLSYIVPSAWLGGPRYVQLRSFLLDRQIEDIVMLPFDVFPDAYIDTAIVVVCEAPPPKSHAVRTYSYGKREKLSAISLGEDQYQKVQQQKWHSVENKKFVLDPHTVQLLERMQKTCSRTIGDVALMKRGVLFDNSLLTERRETDHHYRYFEGDIYRYRANMKLGRWVEFGLKMKERPKEFFWFEGTRILLRRLVNRRQRLMAMLVTETFITNKNLYTVLPCDDALDPRILLAVLNSKLISYLYLKQVSQATKDDFPQVTIRDIRALPFPPASRVSDRSSQLAALVEHMLALRKKLAAATIPADKELYRRQIEATDRLIDCIVYQLYGLTEEEVGVVEGQNH